MEESSDEHCSDSHYLHLAMLPDLLRTF